MSGGDSQNQWINNLEEKKTIFVFEILEFRSEKKRKEFNVYMTS